MDLRRIIQSVGETFKIKQIAALSAYIIYTENSKNSRWCVSLTMLITERGLGLSKQTPKKLETISFWNAFEIPVDVRNFSIYRSLKKKIQGIKQNHDSNLRIRTTSPSETLHYTGK